MPAFALPQSLEEQLDELAGEIRRLRILRGFSWLVTVLFAAPLAAIALDASFDLSGHARGALLGGWVALGFAAAWWFVMRRFRQTIPPDAIARCPHIDGSLLERAATSTVVGRHRLPVGGSCRHCPQARRARACCGRCQNVG